MSGMSEPSEAKIRAKRDGTGPAGWTFLTNHAHVLIRIAMEPRVLVRTLAEEVGIRERAVLRIIAELEEAGYLSHAREGRQNVYEVSLDKPLRHPIERHKTVGALIDAVALPGPAKRRPAKIA
jgi:DNA-binding transcriptional ArsR family regulator